MFSLVNETMVTPQDSNAIIEAKGTITMDVDRANEIVSVFQNAKVRMFLFTTDVGDDVGDDDARVVADARSFRRRPFIF